MSVIVVVMTRSAAPQEAKAQTREEPVVQQEVEQEERVQTMSRRKPRQLSQKVRIESAVAETADQVVETVPAVQPEAVAPRTELAKVDLPAVVESNGDHDDNNESRRSQRYAASLPSLAASSARQRPASSSLPR